MKTIASLLLIMLLVTSCSTISPGVYSYPATGQSTPQVSRDQAECQAWAQQQSGYNPVGDTALQAFLGGLVGAGVGAALGEIIGGEPGKGAAAGGLAGVIVGGTTGYTRSRDGFARAYAACMNARGYVVR